MRDQIRYVPDGTLICHDCQDEIASEHEAIKDTRTEPHYEQGVLHPSIETNTYIVHADRRICHRNIANETPRCYIKSSPEYDAVWRGFVAGYLGQNKS
jgi:hypothetical protein